MKTVVGAQGEVTFFAIGSIPTGIELKPAKRCEMGWIVSHSEKGHHHICTGGEVMERSDVPAGGELIAPGQGASGARPRHRGTALPSGLRVLYAILKEPAAFIQDAPTPHERHELPAGFYEFRIARVYDLFAEQARQVRD